MSTFKNETEQLRRDCAGFLGKFRFMAYDDGSEVLEYVGPDGDDDDPILIAEGCEQHVGEPIARMLNAASSLIVERDQLIDSIDRVTRQRDEALAMVEQLRLVGAAAARLRDAISPDLWTALAHEVDDARDVGLLAKEG